MLQLLSLMLHREVMCLAHSNMHHQVPHQLLFLRGYAMVLWYQINVNVTQMLMLQIMTTETYRRTLTPIPVGPFARHVIYLGVMVRMKHTSSSMDKHICTLNDAQMRASRNPFYLAPTFLVYLNYCQWDIYCTNYR